MRIHGKLKLSYTYDCHTPRFCVICFLASVLSVFSLLNVLFLVRHCSIRSSRSSNSSGSGSGIVAASRRSGGGEGERYGNGSVRSGVVEEV